MMNSRWQANKIGLINFWYYDEQEFPFVKGRMLLRGSNGSGKSVTMFQPNCYKDVTDFCARC